jgi:hypothetical protein
VSKDAAMIRFLFRFVGLWLLAGAFVALIIDGTRSIAASRLILTALREAWSAVHPASLTALQAWAERGAAAWIWDPVAVNVLSTPLWVVLALIGIVLIVLGRPRARPIGYSSRD